MNVFTHVNENPKSPAIRHFAADLSNLNTRIEWIFRFTCT